MKSKKELSVSSEYKPETTTPIVPPGKPFPNSPSIPPEKMDTETLTAFVTSNAKEAEDLAVRSESLKPYYLELRSRIPQKEWDKLCKTTFRRTRRAIDYWLAGGNPVSKRKGHKPQYASPTPDGHNNMEARSALQKGIRLCPDGTTEVDAIERVAEGMKACNEDGVPNIVLTLHEQNVMYWTDQLYRAGADMWKKVFVVLYEDVALAELPVWDEVRKIGKDVRDYGLKDGNGGDKNAIRCAVLLLCRAKKSRATDNVSTNERLNPGWRLNTQAEIEAAMKAADEAEKVKREVPDYALDKHNPRGKALGRGLDHFMDVGTKLANPGDVREVFSPDYIRGYKKGLADRVSPISTPPTKLEKPKPTKKKAA